VVGGREDEKRVRGPREPETVGYRHRTALWALGAGFVETNNPDINPEDGAGLAELKEPSLVLLSRLMSVFVSESRHLLDPEDPQAHAEYRENFSIEEIRLDIHQHIESGEPFAARLPATQKGPQYLPGGS